jgi:hypothetical protein
MNKEEVREKIWRIADGIPFKLGNMTIRTTDTGKLLITGWTNTVHFENISKQIILQELDEVKSSFTSLSRSFQELNDIIKGNELSIEYHIAYDDAGKTGIGLCSEIDGILNWYI